MAIGMIALILLQRGAGATAGAAFGGGASGTVFGSRGATSFLTKATAFLATCVFGIALAMAVMISRGIGINDSGGLQLDTPVIVSGDADASNADSVIDAATDVPATDIQVATPEQTIIDTDVPAPVVEAQSEEALPADDDEDSSN